jgi:sec-independent protein translocase protein TatC
MKETPSGQMTFLQHLEELRRRLMRSAVWLVVAFSISLFFARQTYAFIVAPVTRYLPSGDKLAFTHLTDPFMLYMWVAFVLAMFVGAPLVLMELWLFIAPALYPKERRFALPFVLFSTSFFVGGGAFGYYVVLPPACEFFIKQGLDWDFRPVLTARELLGFEGKLLLGMGLVFEMPILVLFLSRMGLVTSRFLLSKFKYAILAIFIIAAVLTPTPDMLTQTLFATPMVLLYLLSIGVAAVFGRKRPS